MMMIRGRRTMTGTALLIALISLSALHAADAQDTYRKSHIKMQKLCSRKLSDALYLVCRERGYNEPFSYSNEDEPRGDPGPGLVDECCYHQCTLGMLEAYCKPLPEEKRVGSRDDVIDQSYLANLPHSTTKDLLEQHPQAGMDYAGDAIKRFAQQR
ncbi:bombyxin B-5 isoform X2 [Monomorium pharaonis]|uniref:bombyxin B-5 isoform X2 n=1 Tax=Monomorium pharaonis TaxID=307658 RepID=UPI00102E1321|nr:bombyxin B-5 isoform X2 [Monomorium pharaonis]